VTKEDLIELRNIFRDRMLNNDFCLGEEHVEKIFRELLGEPEPVTEINYNSISTSSIKAEDIVRIFSESIDVKKIFERDDTFFRKLK
jgi:hypothetical protein